MGSCLTTATIMPNFLILKDLNESCQKFTLILQRVGC